MSLGTVPAVRETPESPPTKASVGGILLVGALYVLVVHTRAFLLAMLPVPASLLGDDHDPIGSVVRPEVTYGAILAVLAVVLLMIGWRDKQFRGLLRAGPSKFLGVFGLGCLASIVLAATGLWRFSWKDAASPLPAYAASLLSPVEPVGLIAFATRGAFLTPVIEEVVFRFGALHYVRRHLRNDWVAILFTSLVFALLHWGPGGPAGLAAILGAFALGTVGGWLVLRFQEGLALAIAVHASRNATELAFLLAAVGNALGAPGGG